jgi:large subunit ribosomal protein L23
MAILEKTTEDKKTTAKAGNAKPLAADLRSVLVKPRISEKAVKSSESGKYIFEVSKKANKISVKKAVEHSYHVSVVQVNMINTDGKHRSGKTPGKMSDFKKAIVTLKKGDKIEVGETA